MHILDQVAEYRPADHPVLVKARGAWRAGQVSAWHRTPAGWVAQVVWRTGPPVFSACVDFLVPRDLVDAEGCFSCVVSSSRWRRHLVNMDDRSGSTDYRPGVS